MVIAKEAYLCSECIHRLLETGKVESHYVGNIFVLILTLQMKVGSLVWAASSFVLLWVVCVTPL